MVSSPMALPFAYFFCFISFFPYFNLSCPDSSVCDDVESPPYPDTALNLLSPNTPPISCTGQSCGDVAIYYPFFLNTSSPCGGKYGIRCDRHDPEEPKPMINLNGREYVVKEIAHPVKVIVLQDIQLGNYLRERHCGFLYNFTDTIHNFSLPTGVPPLGSSNPSTDCEWEIDTFSTFLFHSELNDHHCNEHNLYSWDEPIDHPKVAPSCLTAEPSLFEWVLSFGGDDGTLSLKSAGFSQQFELWEDCFYCQVTGKSCRSNSSGGCSCENICEPQEKGSKTQTAIIGVGAGVGGVLILGCVLVIFLCNRRKKQHQSSLSNLLSRSTSTKMSSKRDPELGDSNYRTHIFSYHELEEATDGFNASRELGDGGFGTVYKGKLKDGRTVAVKRLYENNYRRLEQFMNEVDILSPLRHPNLVTLYGCTSRHSRELLLVYEFISNGTLSDHLHGPLASKGALQWPTRMSIAIETADALAYLHAIEPQIIHRDVKTNNILLDSNFHVKVADFGLSRLFPLDATHVSTAPQGTPGYVDPEYHQCYQLTDKSDVYSFGVVLVELISSKPAVDISRHRHEINLSNMAINKIQNCQIDQLVDPDLGYQTHVEIKGMINQVAELAFRCLQSDRDMRPCIKEVLEVLKGIEGVGYNGNKEVEVTQVQAKEESRLLKNVSPFSPDTVTERWSSQSTTPNTSG